MNKYITTLDKTLLVPMPTGRELTAEETEKMWLYFKDHSWCNRFSDNKLYFGCIDSEPTDNNEELVWGYITDTELSKIKVPKKEIERPVSNKILREQNWHKKLMKKIK